MNLVVQCNGLLFNFILSMKFVLLNVRRLIPAEVTECHREKGQSNDSDFWPEGIALFFFWLLFSFGQTKEKK